MPNMPPNPCRYRGCPDYQIGKTGFCAKHRPVAIREYDKKRIPSIDNFYTSMKWRSLRAYKLEISPFCEECLKNNRLTEAVMVHHKVPVDPYNKHLWLALDNLQSLCHSCHERTKG